MGDNDDLDGMGARGDDAIKRTETILGDQEAALLKNTATNLETFRAQISDQVAFDAMLGAVNAATQNNENIAQLKGRLTQLGNGVLEVAKKVAILVAK